MKSALLVFALCASMMAAPCKQTRETPKVDKVKLQNLQKSVNQGKELWRLEAKKVAAHEVIERDASYKGSKTDLAAVPLKEVTADRQKAVYAYQGPDGKQYGITLQRFEWLLPYAGVYSTMMWTPTEITVAECPQNPKIK